MTRDAGLLMEPAASLRRTDSHVFGASLSWIIAILVIAMITLSFGASSDRFQHWFLVPIFLCGVLAGVDAVEWFRGRVHAFNPIGMVGVYATFSLFLVPLLHVQWDLWMYEVPPPPDWREWLGYMALLNVVGLIAYRLSKKFFSRPRAIRHRSLVWRPRRKGFVAITTVTLCATAALQAAVYIQLGGVSGYIEQFHKNADDVFAGMGWLFMFSESFPILAAFALIIYARRRTKPPGWIAIGLLLAVFFVVQLFFGGFRGSRLNTVLPVLWIVGAIHFFLRPVPKRVLFGGVGLLLLFLQVYAFYKFHADITATLDGSGELDRLKRETGYSMHTVILADLGRADVQAYMLYMHATNPKDFQYALGRTYLSAVSLLIPQQLFPWRPAGKLKEGTDFQWGPGSYHPGLVESRRVYGLAGEAMMNFSPVAVPFAFALLGFIVARFSEWIRTLHAGDLRLLLAPLGVYMCFSALNMDSDIILFLTVKNGLMPGLFIAAITTRFRMNQVLDASERLLSSNTLAPISVSERSPVTL